LGVRFDEAAMGKPLRFSVIFLLLFGVLAGGFEASRGTAFEHVAVVDLILVPTVALINVVTPQDHVELRGRTLVSGGAQLHVTRGCEGVELLLLLTAAIAAFPARLGHKAQGWLIGFVLAYVLSVARLMILDYTLRYAPGAWEAMHGLIMPLVPVCGLALYFQRWSGRDSAACAAA
jgi:exosortase family protein XrtM